MAQTYRPEKNALLALLHFETSYLHNVFFFFLIKESVCCKVHELNPCTEFA